MVLFTYINAIPLQNLQHCKSGVWADPLQEDVVMGTLTVRENLRFSAALRLPSSVPQNEKEARVNHLIKELGLTKVADSKVHLHPASWQHLLLSHST